MSIYDDYTDDPGARLPDQYEAAVAAGGASYSLPSEGIDPELYVGSKPTPYSRSKLGDTEHAVDEIERVAGMGSASEQGDQAFVADEDLIDLGATIREDDIQRALNRAAIDVANPVQRLDSARLGDMVNAAVAVAWSAGYVHGDWDVAEEAATAQAEVIHWIYTETGARDDVPDMAVDDLVGRITAATTAAQQAGLAAGHPELTDGYDAEREASHAMDRFNAWRARNLPAPSTDRSDGVRVEDEAENGRREADAGPLTRAWNQRERLQEAERAHQLTRYLDIDLTPTTSAHSADAMRTTSTRDTTDGTVWDGGKGTVRSAVEREQKPVDRGHVDVLDDGDALGLDLGL